MPIVHVIHPYGDFPELKRGDIVSDPSPELLKVAAKSTCFEILPDPEESEETEKTSDTSTPPAE